MEPGFAARVDGAGGARGNPEFVDVLHLTGPALVEAALESFLPAAGRRRGLGAWRRDVAREVANAPDTWDRASYFSGSVSPSSADKGGGKAGWSIVVLPYCFFRSRGCPHLQKRFNDSVVFHHEFDTAWRPSFWHNYFKSSPA